MLDFTEEDKEPLDQRLLRYSNISNRNVVPHLLIESNLEFDLAGLGIEPILSAK